MGTYKRTFGTLLLAAAVLAACILVLPRVSRAEDSACATVTMEIPQELTLERIAFDAKMTITNSIPDKDLTGIRVDVVIKDADGNLKNDLFFVRLSSNSNLAAVDGTGVVAAATRGEAHWLIIPSPGAGGQDSAGVYYYVGATLTYAVNGVEEVVNVNPAQILVKPEPQLTLDYFLPYEVLGDNPFTPQIEAPVPFPLAVRVLNEGFGPARSLKIDSAQPKITANDQGLLAGFRLLGAAVNDSAVSPSLTVDIGTLDSRRIATAYWDMISTLTGKFVDFKVSFSHASELGGELTSLIKATNAHYLIRRVKVNLPGRDNLLDFLATESTGTAGDPGLPDLIFESEISNVTGTAYETRLPVTTVNVIGTVSRPTPSAPEVSLSVQTGQAGWVYTKLADPSQGLLTLLDVVRSDGVHLDPHNFWVQEGVDQDFKQTFMLHLLDYRAAAGAPGAYTLVFTTPEEDVTPPDTRLIFDGPAGGTAPLYVTPETRIVFLAEDNDGGSGVEQMLKSVGTDTFTAALPLTLSTAGTYTLRYYSTDRAGNEEAVKTATIIVDDAAPAISAFQAAPPVISPAAPQGIAAARAASLAMTAADEQQALQATIDIAAGAVFDENAIVRTLRTTVTSGETGSITWDGKNASGMLVPSGAYTARLRVSDGLDSAGTPTVLHTATATTPITVADWFTGQPLDPNLSGSQRHPKVSGTRVVWQDDRSGSWRIYTKSTGSAESAPVSASTGSYDQQHPAISGTTVVWQDDRNGTWDIYGHDLATSTTFTISADPGNQERPVVDGDWVAWQDDRNGNWDIHARNLVTGQTYSTGHVRDQMHPAIAGTTLSWEDYRFGLGEIYAYDLANGGETRYTVNIDNQTLPAVSGGAFAWTDQRNGQRDIYYSPGQNSEARVTYGSGDHSQASLREGIIAYTDYEAGVDDPNLSFFDTASGFGAVLTTDPSRQDEPALGSGVLLWQDDRDGVSQIYWSPFQVLTLPITAEIRPGLNLVAVGDRLSQAYPTTSSLIAAAPNGLAIGKIVAYNGQDGTFLDTSAGSDAALQKGMAIGLYAAADASLELGDSGETALYTLLPGTNYIGMLTVPMGYSAYTMLRAIGLDHVQSVRRFNSRDGLWETASVRDLPGTKTVAGSDFAVRPGDGLIVVMKDRVDGWKP